MKHRKLCLLCLDLAALWTLASSSANAQFFSYAERGDVLAGFRKTGLYQGNYELVVNLGNVTNFLGVTPGSTISISAFSPAQLADAFPNGFPDIQWSVFSAFSGVAAWATPLGSFPETTFWYTLARSDINAPTTPEPRFAVGSQLSITPFILGIGDNAVAISGQLGTTNADNNSSLVREPVLNDGLTDLTSGIGDPNNSADGDLGGTMPVTVENTIPNTFTSPSRSDFYQSCPASAGGRHAATYIDPITGLTNGPAYWVGYFQLNTDGTMSFTRATTNAVVAPPPAVTLKIARSGNSSVISFVSSNSVIYKLFYTNSAGLTTPVSDWPFLSGTISGDGTSKSFQDTTTDRNRFYQVQSGD